jgi:BirA family transcriptional regulator, biotin operon repressor / biotin---[acetyl-CoA-carboxylase] ligase
MMPTSPSGNRLLELLRARQGRYCSGTALAADLGLTRTAIWKQVRSLKERGYPIVSHAKQGYQLLSMPDLLLADEVLAVLETRWLGKTYHFLPRIGSTNEHALQLAAQGSPHGTVVVAEEQVAGRGRMGRPWMSIPQRGLYLSMILADGLPSRDAPQTTLIAALALVEVILTHYGLPARIKWPNDILIRGKKVAGILTEMQGDQDVVRFLVIGIGINVNHSLEELNTPFRYPATSIAIEREQAVRRSDLLAAFLKQFEGHYERFRVEGLAPFLADLEHNSAILGHPVTIQCGPEQITGTALGLTTEGALRLGLENGLEKVIWVGDITQLVQ